MIAVGTKAPMKGLGGSRGDGLEWSQETATYTPPLAVVRTREDLVEMRVAANQLAALLETWWPGARSLFATSSPRSPWSSSPAIRPPPRAARLGEGSMPAFCARQHYPGRRPFVPRAACRRELRRPHRDPSSAHDETRENEVAIGDTVLVPWCAVGGDSRIGVPGCVPGDDQGVRATHVRQPTATQLRLGDSTQC